MQWIYIDLNNIMQHNKYDAIQYNTIRYDTIQYNTVQYKTILVQYSTIKKCTTNRIQYSIVSSNELSYITQSVKCMYIWWSKVPKSPICLHHLTFTSQMAITCHISRVLQRLIIASPGVIVRVFFEPFCSPMDSKQWTINVWKLECVAKQQSTFLYISTTPAFLPTITSFQIQLRICDLVDGLSCTANLDMYLFQLDSNS